MEDIWPLILENLKDMRKIIQLSLISKLLLRIIKTHHWYCKLYISHNDLLEYVLDNYHLKNLCLGGDCDVDQYVNKLIYCHTLDLSCTNVTDKDVNKLIHCYKINLRYTRITDKGVEKLIHCKKLYLCGTSVTDQCKQKLRDHGVKIYNYS